ncbi:hypothetical protein OBBRIDRAFT_51398 [Obba rivulosa]|uniref:Uncharacterized protein n=1 Tax=Obba rivulosa TaxID=1052685 RepID=A0A8E2DSF5_9APHY|nr:hypothetical protein OBBRIDRAFT_51398 [Obba rivulosa]
MASPSHAVATTLFRSVAASPHATGISCLIATPTVQPHQAEFSFPCGFLQDEWTSCTRARMHKGRTGTTSGSKWWTPEERTSRLAKGGLWLPNPNLQFYLHSISKRFGSTFQQRRPGLGRTNCRRAAWGCFIVALSPTQNFQARVRRQYRIC